MKTYLINTSATMKTYLINTSATMKENDRGQWIENILIYGLTYQSLKRQTLTQSEPEQSGVIATRRALYGWERMERYGSNNYV